MNKGKPPVHPFQLNCQCRPKKQSISEKTIPRLAWKILKVSARHSDFGQLNLFSSPEAPFHQPARLCSDFAHYPVQLL